MNRLVTRTIKGLPFLALLLLVINPIVLSQEVASTADYYRVETLSLEDGTRVDQITINGPPTPPAGYERPAIAPSDMNPETTVILQVPAFDWCYGCSATSAAMIAAYYDRTGFPDMYTGPTNGGQMPMDNSSWGAGECPLSATHQGIDGRTEFGHVDDYWNSYLSRGPDPYYGNWAEHTIGDCTSDYMRTNRWHEHENSSWTFNVDGSTRFYNYTNGTVLNHSTLQGWGPPYSYDGGVGFKLFYESRGYVVANSYNQYIVEASSTGNGFTYDQYKAEIDAGRPVMLNLEGHTIVGVGYDDTLDRVYLNDTWDHQSGYHYMTWGGSYSGMAHLSVTIVQLTEPTAVKLVRFEAEPEGAAIHVEWETASEIDNLGFNLYRAGTENGPWAKLNDALIPGQVPGHPGGAVYTWYDDGIVPGVTYYYRIEDIDVDGTSTFHGPVSATVRRQRLRPPSRRTPFHMP